ncbi:MAG: hypothetical protein LBG46_06125 [Elusimicrobiota bacterium]|jgi:3-hydroxyacyl-[acyl-carrier-protein] dehydratase|nr:hypothetical protein [Elusimicrobiota bacterium]
MTIDKAIAEIYKPSEQGAIFTLPDDFLAFKGHFPEEPILPAVVQIKMAVYAVSKQRKASLKLKGIKKAKFAVPVKTRDTISIIIEPKNDFYDVSIKNETTIFSSFQIFVQ